MLSVALEFFAMCAGVVLHGRVARPPFARAAVKARVAAVRDPAMVRAFGARSG